MIFLSPLFGCCLFLLASENAAGGELSLQCEQPRADIFRYSDGKASIVQQFTTGEMMMADYQLLGFDSISLRAVFFHIDNIPMITIFEINFANPSVVEHRFNPWASTSFQFTGCRRIN